MEQKKKTRRRASQITAIFLTGLIICAVAACGKEQMPEGNLIINDEGEERSVKLFGPMGKTDPDAENTLRTAQERTVIMAEKATGITVDYNTYTAQDYQEKTYDDVCIERVRSGLDDFYLLNPDVIKVLGEEGMLADLSDLEAAKNLREVVKTANTVNGKLVAIPQEIVAYGLFLNQDLFDRYNLEHPQTPEEFLECCRVFQENGYETPVGANRWWLETFVLSQGFADLYNGGNTEAEIQAINSGKKKLSDYMRPGFEFLKEMLDKGYLDAKAAYTYEAIDGEGADFKAQKTPMVMAYWGAANTDYLYGNVDFNLQVIGFPTSRGQMPVVSMTGYGISAGSQHLEDTKKILDQMLSDEALSLYMENNQVISPSKNLEVDCVDALKPLNDRINEGVYVLGSNANLRVEQWGNTCLIVRELLNGASVDACMKEFDRLQEDCMKKDGAGD